MIFSEELDWVTGICIKFLPHQATADMLLISKYKLQVSTTICKKESLMLMAIISCLKKNTSRTPDLSFRIGPKADP